MTDAPAVVWPDGVVARPDEPLARHSPWRVGGPCELYVVLQDRATLDAGMTALRESGLKRTIVGAGTRTVFRDGGLAGAVVRLGQGFVGVDDDGDAVWAGAATPLGLVAASLPGLAHLRFAPGSLGASLALDEGWEGHVDRVRYVQRGGEREAAWADLPARTSILITAARLRRDGTGKAGPALPGGWFAPPEKGDDTPRELLRDATLSATRLRRVLLPAAEPDRLVNLGGGTAKDLQLLQKSAVERVHVARGIQLQDRMTWLGRP